MTIPWWAKIAAKIVLARLPLGPSAWRALGVFRPGSMHKADYAVDVVEHHLRAAGFDPPPAAWVGLELGPGDSVASAVVAAANGARRVWLVDVGRFAVTDLEPYRQVAALLAERGRPVPDLGQVAAVDDLLAACNAAYLTDGLASLKSVPDGSVDVVWSQAVLEHVRRRDFADTLAELRRVLKPGGVCSHRIDLSDHLGGALNNLRFPERLWESEFFARSGFYTNRIGFSEILAAFREAGFQVEVTAIRRWPSLPTSRPRLAAPFRDLPEDELTVRGFDLLARPLAAD